MSESGLDVCLTFLTVTVVPAKQVYSRSCSGVAGVVLSSPGESPKSSS